MTEQMMVVNKYPILKQFIGVAVFGLLFIIVFLLFGSRTSAISGAGAYFPDTSYGGQGASYAIVQVTGSNVPNANTKMKARTTIANVYVPTSMVGQTVTVTVTNGCDGTIRDNDSWAGHTNFRIRNSTTPAAPLLASVSTNASVDCLVGPNINMSFVPTAIDSSHPYYPNAFTLDNGVSYNVYQFIADGNMIEAGSSARYLNAFGLLVATPGLQVGISSFPAPCDNFFYPISCPTPRFINGNLASWVYTSFYGPSPASILPNYNQKISIGSDCEITGGGISFYDLDASDGTLSQANMEIRLYRAGVPLGTFTPNGTYVEAISVLGMRFWEGGVPGLLNPHPGFGGNNDQYMDIPGGDPMFSGLGNFERGIDYELQINGIDSDNAIQILPNYALCQTNENPIGYIDSCSQSGGQTVIYGWAYDDNSANANQPQVSVNVGGTVQTVDSPYDYRSAQINPFIDSAGYGNRARDNRYGFRVTYSGLTRGNSYAISGTVINVGNGSNQAIGINIGGPPAGGGGGGYGFPGNVIPQECLNRPPTITVVTVNCDIYRFTVNDADGDAVSLNLLVNDAVVAGAAYNLTGQTASNTEYTFNIGDWRDFNSRKFEIRANDGGGNVDAGETNVGPCVRAICGGITVIPSNLEVNRAFTITTNFITRNIADTANMQIGARGNAETYNVNITIAPAGFGTPGNPVVAGAPLNSSSSNPLNHTVGGFRAPASPVSATINYSLDSANNNADVNGCSTVVQVASVPYVQTFRGDVIAGYGIKNNISDVCTDTSSTVRATTATTLTNVNEFVGSGAQTATLAFGAVTGFRSAITESGRNASPWLRTFANSNRTATSALGSGTFGGSFDTSLCAENWSDDKPVNITTINSGTDLDLNTLNGLARYQGNGGPVRIFASGAVTGTRKIFVEGDAIIGNDGADIINSTSWNSIYDIPSTVIVATGNIYIDGNVRRLDAILVSEGTVFTCTPSRLVLPSGVAGADITTVNPAEFRDGGLCYTNSLTINGAIVASSVRLWRTGGTLSRAFTGSVVDSTGYQVYNEGLTQAETIRLAPDVYVAPRFGENPTNGEPGKKQYDSLISLPPPF